MSSENPSAEEYQIAWNKLNNDKVSDKSVDQLIVLLICQLEDIHNSRHSETEDILMENIQLVILTFGQILETKTQETIGLLLDNDEFKIFDMLMITESDMNWNIILGFSYYFTSRICDYESREDHFCETCNHIVYVINSVLNQWNNDNIPRTITKMECLEYIPPSNTNITLT